MGSISKTVAILVILLLATSFVLGNIFSGYKAEKIAQEYKDKADIEVQNLGRENMELMLEQKAEFVRLALQNGINPEKLEPLLEKNGIFLLQLGSATEDASNNLDWEYLVWLSNQRKPERKIFHVQHSIY